MNLNKLTLIALAFSFAGSYLTGCKSGGEKSASPSVQKSVPQAQNTNQKKQNSYIQNLNPEEFTVLITGANRGIGFELAKQYANDGVQVIATARNLEKSKELLELKDAFKKVNLVTVDTADLDSIQNLSDQLKDIRIDLLINNAGIMGNENQTLGKISAENMIEVFKTNTIGPLKLSEALINNLKISEMKCIVTLSTDVASISSFDHGGFYAYGASKAAVNRVMKALSVDLSGDGIHVLLIHPGWLKTDLGGASAPHEVAPIVEKLRTVVSEKCPHHTGKFYDFEGNPLAW